MERALEILRKMAEEESAKRANLLPPDHNYDHLGENSSVEAEIHGQRAFILDEAIRRIEKEMT